MLSIKDCRYIKLFCQNPEKWTENYGVTLITRLSIKKAKKRAEDFLRKGAIRDFYNLKQQLQMLAYHWKGGE